LVYFLNRHLQQSVILTNL